MAMKSVHRCRQAANSLYILSALYLAHTWIGLLHSDEMVHPYITATVSIIVTGIICALLVYVARGVRYGKRLGGTIALLGFLSFQALVVAAIMWSIKAPNEVPLLRGIQYVYVIVLVIACALTLLVSISREDSSIRGR